MNFNGESLCCWEYFDVEQQRNHILACCCNCHYLDVSCDNFIRGKIIPSNVSEGLLLTLQDRLRVPWYGGARKVAPDIVTPIILIPTMLILGSISVLWTVIMFTFTFVLLFYLYTYESVRRSKFFFMWTMTTLTTLLLVFEFLVVPFLEILIHENVVLVLVVTTCFICVRISRARTKRLQYSESEAGDRGKTQSRCSFCNVAVPEKDYHCFWIDTCIGSHNRRLTFIAAALAIISLLYNANLTLTTVCHPFVIYKTILLPDDCSEVYEQFEYSLCFSAAVYSICIAVLLTTLFIYRISRILFKIFRFNTINIKLSSIVPTACCHWINRCCYRASYQRTIEQY